MMQWMVDDLDAWWAPVTALNLPDHFPVPAPRPPAVQPWGPRIGDVIDPSRVLWHIAERRRDIVHDQ